MAILSILESTSLDETIRCASKWFILALKRRIIVGYSGIFYFCQYLHIGAGILSFGGDVFRS